MSTYDTWSNWKSIRPSISNVQALITTKWGTNSYRAMALPFVENYYIDSSLDNDADTWQISIGDPHGNYIDMFDRDTEVRVQLFGVGQQGENAGLITCIADEISYDEVGTITLTGRDLSSLATDSVVMAQKWQSIRAWALIEQQAKEIGFKATRLARGKIVKKIFKTDGSETYWEFWYRLYRAEKMWIWCESDGMLVASTLNYGAKPSYLIGTPPDDLPEIVRKTYLPVDTAEIRKTTHAGVYEVVVLGHKGDVGFTEVAKDPTIKDWLKKPRKLIEDPDAHTAKAARKAAWDEIFEGKVGSRELKVTMPDPGYIVRQNRIARVRIPMMNISGEWFVVGIRIQGGPNGFLQEIRMREKQYALTRRVPEEPKTTRQTRVSGEEVLYGIGEGISGVGGLPDDWTMYFVRAAQKWHGPWDYALFLSCLLAMCEHETGFRNVRQHGGPGADSAVWYPYGKTALGVTIKVPGQPAVHGEVEPRAEYERKFANNSGGKYNVPFEMGVGPMQLTDRGLKEAADNLLKAGHIDEFEGGRWHPEHNIMKAAELLRSYLKQISQDSGRDDQIWMGVMAYNRGVAGAQSYWNQYGRLSSYAADVKQAVKDTYLGPVQSQIKAAQDASKAVQDGFTSSLTGADDKGPLGSLRKLTRQKLQVKLHEALDDPFGLHPFKSPAEIRQIIVMVAMWGYLNRDSIGYSQSAQREQDFGPPPNVPGNTDCSAFAEWCYVSARAPNPGSTTYQQRGRGRAISYAQIQPGDLIFYGPDQVSRSDHVAVYVGDNQVIEHGSEQGPIFAAPNYRPIVEIRTYPMR